jgi:hypothetical protein
MKKLLLLRQTYADPSLIEGYTVIQWNLLLRQSYCTGLVARMFYLFKKNKLCQYIPKEIYWHFASAMCFADSYQQDILIEMSHIERAFHMAGISPVYLKGVAYLLAQDEAGKGRVFSDIDVYVSQNKLADVERFLKWQGWSAGDIDKYDDNYYRQWMHEIPALTHQIRGSTLDLHHNLIPLTSRLSIKTPLIELNIKSGTQVLAIEDRIIHSMCHLFLEGEFSKGMRDMTDLDLLIRQYGDNDSLFFERLTDRAIAVGAGKIIFYALRYLNEYLGTQVDSNITGKLLKYRPSKRKLRLMDRLFGNVLFNPLALDNSMSNQLSHGLMFIRAHWLRMPLHLLIPHLLRKAFVSPVFQWKKNQLDSKNR